MPAVSKAQQRFMGMVYAVKKGYVCSSSEVGPKKKSSGQIKQKTLHQEKE